METPPRESKFLVGQQNIVGDELRQESGVEWKNLSENQNLMAGSSGTADRSAVLHFLPARAVTPGGDPL